MRLQTRRLADRPHNRLGQRLEVDVLTFPYLKNAHDLLLVLRGGREGRHAARSDDDPVGLLGRHLDVLWIIILSSDNDKVFEAARDVQTPVLEEALVARPQVAAPGFRTIVQYPPRVEGLQAQVGLAPVASCYTTRREPDLAPRRVSSRDRIYDPQVALEVLAAARQVRPLRREDDAARAAARADDMFC